MQNLFTLFILLYNRKLEVDIFFYQKFELIIVIGSTQYYTTRLNRRRMLSVNGSKLSCDSKNRCRAENGGKVLNRQNSVD